MKIIIVFCCYGNCIIKKQFDDLIHGLAGIRKCKLDDITTENYGHFENSSNYF